MGLTLILLIIVVLLVIGLGVAAVMGGLETGINTILNATGVDYEINFANGTTK